MDTTEEYIKRILKVLVYIEEHIEDEITMSELAKLSCYSPFHFHRIFQSIVGETVYQYTKRLRLERAAGKLRNTAKPVTEIALDASYDTPSAFTKAFKLYMGTAPRNYRMLHAAVHIVTNKIKESPMIQPDKIEKIVNLPLLFIRRVGSYDKTPWDAWKAMNQFVEDTHLDKLHVRRFGIGHDDPQITDEDKIRYDACILQLPGMKEKGEVGQQTLKGGKYAVFTHNGLYERLEATWNRILLKWLPTSCEQLDDTRPPFCEHFHMEYYRTDSSKLITKIYIPIL